MYTNIIVLKTDKNFTEISITLLLFLIHNIIIHYMEPNLKETHCIKHVKSHTRYVQLIIHLHEICRSAKCELINLNVLLAISMYPKITRIQLRNGTMTIISILKSSMSHVNQIPIHTLSRYTYTRDYTQDQSKVYLTV